jgi:hypothetical protein
MSRTARPVRYSGFGHRELLERSTHPDADAPAVLAERQPRTVGSKREAVRFEIMEDREWSVHIGIVGPNRRTYRLSIRRRELRCRECAVEGIADAGNHH